MGLSSRIAIVAAFLRVVSPGNCGDAVTDVELGVVEELIYIYFVNNYNLYILKTLINLSVITLFKFE
jgi:hypothetical protein